MSPTPAHDTIATHRPTLGQRIKHWLGFRFPGIPDMEDRDFPDLAPGYMHIHTTTILTFRERLLILMGGNLASCTVSKTDVVVSKSLSLASVTVIAPGEFFQ